MTIQTNFLWKTVFTYVVKYFSIPFISMESVISDQLTTLVQRLNEAERRSKLLSLEVKDIKKEIAKLTQSEIIKNHTALRAASVSTSTSSASTSSRSTSTVLTNKRTIDLTDSFEDNKKLKVDFTRENDYVVVYTDGACENNGRANAKAGIGIWFGDNHPLNISKPVNGKATNNTAEIQACINAVRVAKDQGVAKLKIYTDSQFTINCMTQWIKRWKKNSWKLSTGGDVKNKTDLVVLDKLCQSVDVQWEHVAGHKGNKGNEEADKLARQGALRYVPD